jgi:hypothetical protein
MPRIKPKHSKSRPFPGDIQWNTLHIAKHSNSGWFIRVIKYLCRDDRYPLVMLGVLWIVVSMVVIVISG